MAKQKKALGRGLSAILSNPKTDITQTTTKNSTATPLGTVSKIKLNTDWLAENLGGLTEVFRRILS